MNIEKSKVGLESAMWPTIFNAVGFGLVLVDAEAHVLLWNNWLTQHSGISAEVALGQSFNHVFGADLAPSFIAALKNSLRYKLPIVLSNVLHRNPLPLYAQAAQGVRDERMPHAITLTPLMVDAWGTCCLIQITDASRALSREKVLQKNSERLNREVITDSLTRAFSRGFFDQFFQQEFARAYRQGSKLSLIMIDVDFFKNYNDTYGHQAGDKALIAVVQALKAGLSRDTDKLARYGGEEFIVILPDCTQSKALVIAEHLRAAVLALKLPHCTSSMAAYVTISLGVSTLKPGPTCSAEALLNATDLALYKAKNQGRNSVQYRSPQTLDQGLELADSSLDLCAPSHPSRR